MDGKEAIGFGNTLELQRRSRVCELGPNRCLEAGRWLCQVAWVDSSDKELVPDRQASGNQVRSTRKPPRAMFLLRDAEKPFEHDTEVWSEVLTKERLAEYNLDDVQKDDWVEWACDGEGCEIKPASEPIQAYRDTSVQLPVRYSVIN